jgi:5-enolpyruvylshikimate-3-phosphate synthase
MANLVSKIEFPRNSPDGLIAMSETLLAQHDTNPTGVSVPSSVIDSMRANVKLAKEARDEAKKLAARAVQLNGNADKILGIAMGQSLSDSSTLLGNIADFRDHANLAFKDNIEQLKEYGFSVKISQKAVRISAKRAEKIRAKKA